MSMKWPKPRPKIDPLEDGELAEKFKLARSRIDPFRTYRLAMPDGTVFEAEGADMIKDADNMAALIEANKRNDYEGFERVMKRIMGTLDR
jgi:hypothetical protein